MTCIFLLFQGLMFGLSYYAQSRKREVFDFKKKHPLLVTLAVFSIGYYLVIQRNLPTPAMCNYLITCQKYIIQ